MIAGKFGGFGVKKKIGMIAAALILAGIFVFTVLGISRHIYNAKARQIYEAQFHLAQTYAGAGELIEARDTYKSFLSQSIDLDLARQAYDKLGDLNIRILFSPLKTADSLVYKVQAGDTLEAIAKKHNTTVALVKKANNIKTELIRPGMKLKVTTVGFSIVVDKSQNILTLKAGEEVFKVYPVSTGANNSTPVGSFKITSKIINPPWFSGGKAILPGDEKNILGSRWMGISLKSYGIHGTTDDASIGTQCTQGCVRMHNRDAEELHDIVPIGTEVMIVD